MSAEEHRVDRPTRCHHCQSPLDTPIGCLSCHTIFPASSELTHFDRLGLPMRYELPLDSLERAYLAWSRELHPDFYQTRSHEEQSLSLKLSASLNDSYSTLKDPARRAEYLLHLFGGPLAAEHRSMPEGFLESVLELRMEIEEAKESGGFGGPESLALKRRLSDLREQALKSIAERFAAIERANTEATADELQGVREVLNAVKYYDGLLRELVESA